MLTSWYEELVEDPGVFIKLIGMGNIGPFSLSEINVLQINNTQFISSNLSINLKYACTYNAKWYSYNLKKYNILILP